MPARTWSGGAAIQARVAHRLPASMLLRHPVAPGRRRLAGLAASLVQTSRAQKECEARKPTTKLGASGVRPAASWPFMIQPEGIA